MNTALHSRARSEPAPISGVRRVAIGGAILAGTTAYLALHLFEPSLSLTWAYAHLNRLPLVWPVTLGAVILLPALSLWGSRLPLMHRRLRGLSWQGAIAAALGLGLLFLAVGWFFPTKAISLDASAFAVEVWKGTIWTTRWYLTLVGFTAILRVVEWLAPVPVPARDVVSVLNTLLAGGSYVLLVVCARRLSQSLWETLIILGLAGTAFGNLQLTLYYMDIYPVVQFAILLFLWGSFRFLQEGGHPAWPILVAMLGPFFYVGLVLLAPAALLVILVALKRPQGAWRVATSLGWGGLLAGCATWPGFGRPFAFGEFLDGLIADSGRQLGLAKNSSLLPLDYLFSIEHLIAYAHTFLLIDGLGLWLCVTAGLPVLAHFLRGRVATPTGVLILVGSAVLLYAFVMDPLWGAYADWDLFSYAAVPTSLLGGYSFVLWGREIPRARAAVFGLLLAASLVHLAARLNALEVEQLRHLQESPSHVVPPLPPSGERGEATLRRPNHRLSGETLGPLGPRGPFAAYLP